MATSYDYTDEFTKQLARKRRLAQLLQEQGLQFNLPNPNARGSWLNALGSIAEAYGGKKLAEQADTEGTAHEQAQQKAMQDAIAQFTQGNQGLPERPDMNLPGDLSALAPDATTRPSTDVSAPMLPKPPAPPPAAPMVPQPPQFNFSGSPKQKAELQAIAESDIRNQGAETLGPQGLTAPPPMPAPQPTPPPSLAGPPPPGALAAPPDQAPPPLIPQAPGQPDMAPKGMMLPAQPGKTPNAFDMLKFASQLPPGQQQAEFMREALKNALVEPDRVQAQKDRQDTLRAHYADINAQRQIAEQQKHEYFMSRVQNEKDRVAEINRHNKESEDIRRGQAGAVAAGGGGQGKAPSGYRWSTEQQGQLEPIPGGPSDPKTIADKKNAIQITGGRESVYATRVMQAANQASKDIGNIMKLPVEAQTTGIFGGRHQGSGLFDATKEVLAQKMTPQEAQAYNVMATGLQRTLAAVETSGLAQGIQEFSKSIDVVAKEGDTNLTKMHKLAQSRQILEAGLDPILANPRISEPEKELVRKTLEVVKQTVPFTHSDLIELTAKQAINPDTTMKELLKKTGEKVPEFKTEAEAAAAEAAGTIKKGSRVKIGGVVGTWE